MPREGETVEEWKERMGIRQRQNKHHVHAGTSRATPVIGDDGALAGRVVGRHVDHWDDRRDAKVTGYSVTANHELLSRRRET